MQTEGPDVCGWLRGKKGLHTERGVVVKPLVWEFHGGRFRPHPVRSELHTLRDGIHRAASPCCSLPVDDDRCDNGRRFARRRSRSSQGWERAPQPPQPGDGDSDNLRRAEFVCIDLLCQQRRLQLQHGLHVACAPLLHFDLLAGVRRVLAEACLRAGVFPRGPPE